MNDYEGTYRWLEKKGIARRCGKHRTYYDSHLGCPQCNETAQAEKRARIVDAEVREILSGATCPSAELSECPACGKKSLFHRQGTLLHECLNNECKRVFEE